MDKKENKCLKRNVFFLQNMDSEERKKIEERIKELEKELENVKGTECEIYSRIVGYFRPVKQWNDGKQEEFKDRVVFDLTGKYQDSKNYSK